MYNGGQLYIQIISDNGKYIREAKGKFTQYKIIHRYYFTPLRLYRMGVMDNSLCWKCQKEAGTLLHCIWQCPCIQPFWRFVLEYLGQWAGRKLPVSPRLCLLGDRSQLHNMSSKAFSVIMVGITVAARTILKHWKTVTIPGFKEWANAMIKTASYEHMLDKLNTINKDKAPAWESFWTYITLTYKPVT